MGNQKRPLPDTKPEIATTNSTSIPLTKPIDSSLDDYDNPPTLDRVASSSSQVSYDRCDITEKDAR